MKVTDVRLTLPQHQNSVRCYAAITLDDCFVVRGLAIKTRLGDGTYYVAMPEFPRRDPDTQNCVAFPVRDDMRREIELAVLEAYSNSLERRYEHIEE